MTDSKCAFHYAYQSPHRNFDSGCQFDADEELFLCGDRRYCRFHLPLADERGQPTHKAHKSRFDPDGFNRKIHDLIEKALAEQKPVNLTGVVFAGKFAFESKKLPEILLYYAVFPGRASFKGTQFTGRATFEDTQFMGDALFKNARFKGDASFEGTQFTRLAQFKGAKFTGYAKFSGAQFMIAALFENAQFIGDTSFWDAQFGAAAWFRGARFERRADFSWSYPNPFDVPGDTVRHGDKQKEKAGPDASFPDLDFSGGRVGDVADFSNRIFTEDANFSGQIFDKAPVFHGSDIHPGTNWDKTEFLEREGHDAERAYRTLRLAMEEMRDRPQEAIFFSLEQQARRKNLPRSSPTRWLSFVYDWTSGYGNKVGRPLLWLAATTFLSFMVYWCFGGCALLNGDVVSASVTLCVQQITQPFKIWSGTYLAPLGLFGGVLPLCVKIFASLQSVFSLTLLALFVLALRWQFRRA